jgi:hypothetical protein
MDMAAERGSTSFRNRPILGNPVGPAQRGYAYPGEFGQIIRAEAGALYAWDEGGSSREPESVVAPTTSPISGRRAGSPCENESGIFVGAEPMAAKVAADYRGPACAVPRGLIERAVVSSEIFTKRGGWIFSEVAHG